MLLASFAIVYTYLISFCFCKIYIQEISILIGSDFYHLNNVDVAYGSNINLVLVLANILVPQCYAHYLVIMLPHTAYDVGIQNKDIGDTSASNWFG